MDPATLASTIAVARKVYKYAGMVVDYIRDDQSARLGLLAPVRMVIEGPGVGIGDFASPDGIFKMVSPNINRLEMDFATFPADENSPWNGPDGIKNNLDGGSLPSSLPHDLICKWRNEIAAALGITVEEVWVWASGVLAAVWQAYGGDNPRAKAESWLGYQLTRIFGKPYMWIKRHLALILLLSALAILPGCAGCAVPDWHVVDATPVIAVEAGVPGVVTNSVPAD